MKTDIQANVGKHAFEIAGLGLAPFRFVGVGVNQITYPNGTTKPGGSCDYCGTAIANECRVKSSDGRLFKVGCDCIAKVGDSGLLKAYKSSPEFRAKSRAARQAKAKAVFTELANLIAANRDALRALSHPGGYVDRKTGVPLTANDWADWMFNNCGDSGRAYTLRAMKKLLAPKLDTVVAV